jgi:hypothetical protein
VDDAPPGEAGEVPSDRDASADLERRILAMLGSRAPTSTICPSDVARDVAPDDWRPLMQPVRDAAAQLVARGQVEITQHGEVVNLATVRGPIRIRLPRGTS